LPEYVRARADLYRSWSTDSPYRSLLSVNADRLLRKSRPAPRAGVVSFVWDDGTTEARRVEFEQRLGLRGGEGPDDKGRWRYEASNVFGLYGLRTDVHDSEGIDWAGLAELNSWLPPLEPARVWLAQITLFVPFLLLGSACVDLTRSWRRGTSAPILRVASRKHQHRDHPAFAAKLPNDLQPRPTRKHHIQDDDVVRVHMCLQPAAFTVVLCVHDIPLLAQTPREKARDLAVVFHNQDPHLVRPRPGARVRVRSVWIAWHEDFFTFA
jgi:hypothetical protein